MPHARTAAGEPGAGEFAGFVGRRAELADLEQALRDVESGEPRVFFVAGPAGIGKSRLIAQFADRIRDRGVLVLHTSCVALGAETIPLSPMTAAIRQLLDSLPRADLTTAVPAANALPALLPELREAGTPAGSVAEQVELFTAVLHRLGRHRPVVWVIDDLHACDASTRELIGSIARTTHATQVMLVCGYRDDAPHVDALASMVAELGRSPAVVKVTLPPFTRGEVRELLTLLSGRSPEPAPLDQILQRSGGNPFYAAELAESTTLAELPDTLQALLTRPLGSLSPDALAVIRIVSVAGRIDHEVLARASALAEDELTKSLREAVAARLVEPVGTGYRMRHALLAEATQAAMLPVERARIHRSCGAALEALGAERSGPEARAALALHWLRSGDARRALPALLDSADAAAAMHAFAEQGRLLKCAMDNWDAVPTAETVTGSSFQTLCSSAAYAAAWAGEYELVCEVVDAALQRIDADSERGLASLLYAHRSMALHHLNRSEVQASVQRALQLLPGEPKQPRMDVLDYLAAVQTLQGRLDQARSLSEEASRLAQESGDPQSVVRTSATLGWVLCELGEYERSRAVLQAAQQGAGDAERDLLQSTRLWLNLAVTALALGDYEGAIDAARSGLAVPEAGLDRTMGLNLLLVLAPALLASGRLIEAEATTLRGLARDPAAPPAAQLHALRADLALLSGDLAGAEREIYAAGIAAGDLEVAPPAPWQLPILRVRAELALAAGDPVRAAATLAPVLNPHQQGSRRDRWEVLIAAARIAKSAELVGVSTIVDLDRVRSLVGQLPVATTQDRAYSAQFVAEAGESGAWERAAATWQECGHKINAARCKHRAATTLLASRRADARDLLEEALGLAEQTGARAIADEVLATARAAHLELPSNIPASPPAQLGLTQRELEILALVAEGSSNRQIGAALYISPKTVSVHVSNILAKLGVSSRGEAAALAHRSGLFR